MEENLPFNILPTKLLKPNNKQNLCYNELPVISYQEEEEESNQSQPIQEIKKSFNPVINRLLDNISGLAILDLIYKRGGKILEDEEEDDDDDDDDYYYEEEKEGKGSKPKINNRHRNTFYIEKNDKKREYGSKVKEYNKKEKIGFIDTCIDYVRMESESNIKHITKQVLINNNITIRDIIIHCGVSITDMKSAGIINTYDDLIELKFNLKDLVRNRKLFDVNKLVLLFGVDYKTMRKYTNTIFDINDLKACKFYAADLQTLQFTFNKIINRKRITKEELRDLNYSLKDLISLGLTKKHLEILNISQRYALHINGLNWLKEDYMRLVG